MEKLITVENIRNFAYVNDEVLKLPLRGIILSFSGCGGQEWFTEDTARGKFFGERGILYVLPYNNPWHWMNQQAVGYTDEVLDAVYKKYPALHQLPIAFTGISMGGYSAMIYSIRGKYKPVRYVLNCPCCDLQYQYEHVQLFRRIFYSAVWHEAGTMAETLIDNSPITLAQQLPAVPYYFFHSETDEVLLKAAHSDRMVQRLRQLGHKVTYEEFTGCVHGDLPEGGENRFRQYLLQAFE
jgi:pimeloyl-ACP methyl ester carboxylesterase